MSSPLVISRGGLSSPLIIAGGLAYHSRPGRPGDSSPRIFESNLIISAEGGDAAKAYPALASNSRALLPPLTSPRYLLLLVAINSGMWWNEGWNNCAT